jgi:thymidylate kinase
MIIIVDGPDGAGKTTLAEYLSVKFGYPIRHRGKPVTQAEKDAMMAEYLNDIKSGANMVWDRGFYSEMVYGPVMRDGSYISNAQMIALEEALVDSGAIVFYCTDDILKLWERCTTRGETYITTIETLAEIKDRFDYLMFEMEHKIPVVRYEVAYGTVPTL